jgi:hypothetical protein
METASQPRRTTSISWILSEKIRETYSEVVRIVKHLSEVFPIQNGLKQRGALSPLLFNFFMKIVVTDGHFTSCFKSPDVSIGHTEAVKTLEVHVRNTKVVVWNIKHAALYHFILCILCKERIIIAFSITQKACNQPF